MRLKSRSTKTADLDACVALIHDEFVYKDAEKSGLLCLWREVLERRCGHSSVVEDENRPRGKQIVAFGLSIFVCDAFVQEAKTRLTPFLGRHVLERWSAGNSPILSFPEVCHANSGDGLNVIGLHVGWRRALKPDERQEALGFLFESFLVEHRGYRKKELLIETYGETNLHVLLTAGQRLITSYEDFFRSRSLSRPSPDKHPYLMSVTRADSMQLPPHSPAFRFFVYAPPRFCFTIGQQELLGRALLGETDKDLADALGLAVITVKKRWEAIFERVTIVDADLLPTTRGDLPEGRRGPEKRRRLLAYLRDHPEELRPADRSQPLFGGAAISPTERIERRSDFHR